MYTQVDNISTQVSAQLPGPLVHDLGYTVGPPCKHVIILLPVTTRMTSTKTTIGTRSFNKITSRQTDLLIGLYTPSCCRAVVIHPHYPPTLLDMPLNWCVCHGNNPTYFSYRILTRLYACSGRGVHMVLEISWHVRYRDPWL